LSWILDRGELGLKGVLACHKGRAFFGESDIMDKSQKKTMGKNLRHETKNDSYPSKSAASHQENCTKDSASFSLPTTIDRKNGESSHSDGTCTPLRGCPFPICAAPTRSASSRNNDDVETPHINGQKDHHESNRQKSDEMESRMPSFHNSNGAHILDARHEAGSAADASVSTTAVSADQERQILLLMLLAQVCALHDPTPRTFTVHVLELFERGILGRQSIKFLFELGLVPSSTPLSLTNGPSKGSTTSLDLKEDTTPDCLTADGGSSSPQTLRSREASAIRSSLEQHDFANQLQKNQRVASDRATTPAQGTFHHPMVASPEPAHTSTPGTAFGSNEKVSSWSVEHHPLSLSRYQREFYQVRLLDAGSFGEVFQSTSKVDLKDYAIKRVTFSAWGYSKDSVSQVIREVHCLAQCDHPNVVRYYTSWLEPSWMTGSGATKMMSKSNGSVRRQQRLLTDIQHMMVTSADGSASSIARDHEVSSEWGHKLSYSSRSTSYDSNHIQGFLNEKLAGGGILRNRNFSIGSRMNSFSSDDAGSSYDETSSEEDDDEDVSAWSIEESHANATEDSILIEKSAVGGNEDSIFIESRRKGFLKTSSSPPRSARQKKKKNRQQKASKVDYRYRICLFIQMQLCHPATLGDWIRHRNAQCADPASCRPERVRTAVRICSQIVGGLHHIHKKGIVHRDLKPANLFRSLEDEEVFLIGDFGLSKLIHSATYHKNASKEQKQGTSHATSDPNQVLVIHPPVAMSRADGTSWQDPLTAGVGTASYAAPEQVTTRTYGMRADIFSLGLILLEMVCCFTTEHERMQTFNDCRNHRSIPAWIVDDFPNLAKTILDCTEPSSARRPTSEDLLKDFCLFAPLEASTSTTREHYFDPTNTAEDSGILRAELCRKNEKLFEYERQLEEKDRTIEQLRQELAQLRFCSEGQSPQQFQLPAMRGKGREAFELDEVASSSSSEDGI